VKRIAKYLEMFKITLLTSLTYFHELVGRQVFLLFIMYVFVQLWRTTYRGEGSTTIAGFTMPQMIWYLTISESIVMGMARTGAEIDTEVKSGSLAYSLTKPYDYQLFHYARYMGDSLVKFFSSLIVAGAVSWALVGSPPFSAGSFAAGLVAAFLGFTMDFWIQMSLGLTAFWVEDTWAFRFFYSRVTMLLGGMMLPLDVFPEWLRKIAGSLPVASMVYGPVKSFVRFDATEWALLLGRQALWIAVLCLVARSIYGTGVKRVNVQGG
jgi:ABC-2 type transport system permease protein